MTDLDITTIDIPFCTFHSHHVEIHYPDWHSAGSLALIASGIAKEVIVRNVTQ